MRLLRLAVASVVLVAAFTVTGLAAAPPAAADYCEYRDQGWVDSGVSSASVSIYWCLGHRWEYRGTLYDTSCDDRTAYLDIYPAEGAWWGFHAPGCGSSTPFTISSYMILGNETKIRTRACNTRCSGSDWDYLHPYG